MMKGKIKLTLTILIAALLAMPFQVNAAKAWVSQNGSKDQEIKYENGKVYQDYHITVQYDDGKNYDAYCVDFGARMNGGNNPSTVTCQEVASPALAYVMNDPNASHEIKQLASRTIAQQMGITKTDHYVTSNNGTMDAVNQLVDAANNQVGGITFTKVSGSENVVTYSLSSAGTLEGVQFECQNCSIQSSNWNGTSGSVTVSATSPNCNFQIIATYNGIVSNSNTKVMYCSGSGNIQGTVFTINGSVSSNASETTTTGQARQVFSGSIDGSTGGNYYREYCEGEKPNTCTCNQKTTVNMPGLCDSGTNNASITAPTDIKCCILNNKDEAGNTYEMLDNQITTGNPYCSVFCKEDYEMTLPGAKYTTSGRFFELENSIVSAKRTCYATSGTARESEEEYNIGIEQFVRDVKAQQEAVIAAFNTYQTAKAKYESVSAIPNSGDTRIALCPEYDGQGNWRKDVEHEYVYAKTGPNKQKVVPNSWDKNVQEGSKGVNTTIGSESATIGYNFSCENGTTVAGDYATVGEYRAAMEEARGVLNEAREQLKQTIEYMEECYNWINDLCMDPVVKFDYDEQYNGSINYTKVSGGGSFPSSNATYSTSKNIDNEYTANEGGSLETVDYAYCTENDCQNGGEGTATNISTLVSKLYYRKIEANGSAEYANVQQFQTNYPSGTIDTVSDSGALRPNYSYLGAVFPVALNTPTGVYKWTLNFSNLGKYNDYVGCGLGRLDTVVAALGESTSAGLEYVCVYVVDCDDCDYDCVGEGCLIPDGPKCPECDVYCTNCIFDGNGNAFYYQVETLNNPDPKGVNWSNEKGEATLKAITDIGESVYIDAQFVYRITPENMAALRKYNAETGNYVSEDLTYHTIGNVTNAYGTSKVLDIGQSKGYFTEIKRTKDRTLWSGAIADGVGPAWKVGK